MNKKQKIIVLLLFIGITGGIYLIFGKSLSIPSFSHGSQEKDVFSESLYEEDLKNLPAGSGVPAADEILKTEDKEIEVYICGAIMNPGVYTLEEGNRVDDLLLLCGGFRDNAYLLNMNLAERLTDGEKIYVMTKREAKEQESPAVFTEEQGEPSKVQDGKVDINKASKELLMTIPGIGGAKAEKIINYRENMQPFSSIEDITKIDGIKNGVFEKIKDFIKV